MPPTAAAPATPLPIARNYLGGAFDGAADSYLDVLDPSDGSVLSRVPVSSTDAVDAAVAAASAAFPAWSATPIKERVQVLYRYRALLERHLDELTTLITRGARQDPERGGSGSPEGDRADRVRLLDAADRDR